MAAEVTTLPERISVERVSKRFGNVTALAEVSFGMCRNEVVALAGGNGSGKSTLLKIIAGVLGADSGNVSVDGHQIVGGGVHKARASGIEMVFQDGALCPDASVLENMFLGAERTSNWGFLKVGLMRQMAADVVDKYQLPIASLRAKVGELSGGQRKAVAIGRALLSAPRFLLLDEPTAALGVKEQQMMLRTVGELSSRGVGIIICTHSPDEILNVAARVLILRHGELITDERTQGLSKAGLAVQMST